MQPTDAKLSTQLEEFSCEAVNYNASRPAYPEEIAEMIASRIPKCTQNDIAVDVGCGTGIFTRSLARAANGRFLIYGVDPSIEMVTVAKAAGYRGAVSDYISGSGENLPFKEGSCIAVTAATAAHRFDRNKFYAEASRLLRADGILAVITTSHDFGGSSLVSEYHRFLETSLPGYKAGLLTNDDLSYSSVNFIGEISQLDKQFYTPSKIVWKWDFTVDNQHFISLSRSSSLIQRSIASIGEAPALNFLKNLFKKYEKNGTITIPHSTEVVTAIRNIIR